jgi:hypothetical protein
MTATAAFTPSATDLDALELDARGGFDIARAAGIYREHGCVVLRGLMARHVGPVVRDIERAAAQAIELLPRAKACAEGWYSPDGTLFLPAPAGYRRAQQIMMLNVGYRVSAALLGSALEPGALALAEAVLGPDLELADEGQVMYKEPVGGHPKHLHQDSAYFTHRYDGPMAFLSYGVDCDERNGCLRVVPGSHRLGLLPHVDTFSHLGLDAAEWPWERSLPVLGCAGDTVVFHVDCIHGSQENHSRAPRPTFIHRYRRVDDYAVVSGASVAGRADAERAKPAKKRNQRGIVVRGFRTFIDED